MSHLRIVEGDAAMSSAAPSDPCDLCEAVCTCGEQIGITEVIQLEDRLREFICTACGRLRHKASNAPSGTGDAASDDPIGACPKCGSATYFYGDRLLDCVNGHPESENKFLLAAVLGIKGFVCSTCSTSKFKFRQLQDH